MIESGIWLLLPWGVVVGMDLTTVPQIGLSRPLVAGAVAGLLLGDVQAGLMIGAVLELFALDVLPVGASKYPDYGLGAIAGATVLANAPIALGLGLAVFVGLTVAYIGGKGIHVVRTGNTADVAARARDIDSGRASVVNLLHARGLLRDAVRAAAVTGIGIVLALLARNLGPPSTRVAVMATLVALGAALASSMGGAVNVAGRTPGVRMYIIGGTIGLAWLVMA